MITSIAELFSRRSVIHRIARCFPTLCLAAFVSLRAAPTPAETLEAEVAAIAAGPQVTVIHFWAPWCANCVAEMHPEGWAAFIEANPEVKFVFLNIWHRDVKPAARLTEAGLGAQPNLLLRTHPNAASKGVERVNDFLGLPVNWLPTTWVFREGKQRYALNYGEVRFPMLQQMVDDSTGKWTR